MPPGAIDRMAKAGALFARRPDGVIRLVTRFDGTEDEVDRFLALLRHAL
jgi:hypothetical protein